MGLTTCQLIRPKALQLTPALELPVHAEKILMPEHHIRLQVRSGVTRLQPRQGSGATRPRGRPRMPAGMLSALGTRLRARPTALGMRQRTPLTSGATRQSVTPRRLAERLKSKGVADFQGLGFSSNPKFYGSC